MKILIVSKHVAGGLPGEFYYPGEWADAYQFARALRSVDANVALLTPRIHPSHKDRFDAEFASRLRETEIRHHFAPTSLQVGDYGGSFRLRLAVGEMRAWRLERPDVVVYLGIGPSLLSRRRRRPVLVPFICWDTVDREGENDRAAKVAWSNPLPPTARWEHGLYHFLARRWGAPTSEAFLAQCDAIAVFHPRGYDILRRDSALADKTFLTIKGVDFAAADAASPLTDKVDGLFLGGIFHRKGVFDLLEAFCRVRAELPDVTLGVAGSGPPSLEHELRQKIENLKINVRCFGTVPFHERWRHLKSARIFAFPSVKDNYNSSILEAMACRLPVITTQAVDSPVEDGVTGFIIAPHDVSALADRILHLLKNEEERARMGALARTKVRDWSDVARQAMDEIFRPALRRKQTEVRS